MNTRIIEVTRNETDWSALVSVDGQSPFSLTFPLGERPTDAAICAAAEEAILRQQAEVATEPVATGNVSIEQKVAIVADLVDKIAFPLREKPTDAEIRTAIEGSGQ
jgi:hypothetical protein